VWPELGLDFHLCIPLKKDGGPRAVEDNSRAAGCAFARLLYLPLYRRLAQLARSR
jgi:hypothetical protein